MPALHMLDELILISRPSTVDPLDYPVRLHLAFRLVDNPPADKLPFR